jgi:hypothetical protein
MNLMTRAIGIAVIVMISCGGRGGGVSVEGPGDVASGDDLLVDPCAGKPRPPDDPCHGASARPEPRPDRVPEVFPPAWTKVGVGQTISFAVTAIDQDLDETRVDVTAMPSSARFDPITQTVTWTPTKKDLPAGAFTLRVSNLGEDGEPLDGRSWEHTWTIEVTKRKQRAPTPPRLSAVVETLLTIREPARLTQVNKSWPFDKMLLRSAELQREMLPPEQQAKVAKLDKQKLFDGFLSSLAEAHQNPRLDPNAREFDKKVFGDPKAWKIVAVRPRIDKKFTELRVVYQAVGAPEPVFAMFRIRPTWDVPTLPVEARAYNNKVFLGMVWQHLLAEGSPSPKLLDKPKVHAKAVDKFVGAVLAFDDSATNPWARAAFLALPTEARLGGGSRRNDDGSYRSGDGWAWTVMKPLPTPDGTALAYVNIPIPGFWTDATASPDGSAWIARCARKFDPDDPAHVAGYEVLCRKALGFVDLPELVDGKVTSARRDAVNLFVEHKQKDMVAKLALDDGRRDHGEENGMSCAQCHIRDFGVRDYADLATADPQHGTPRAPNPSIPTLDFQIVPGATWPAFTVEFMKDQECRAAKQIEQFLGKPSGLTCPLAP